MALGYSMGLAGRIARRAAFCPGEPLLACPLW